MKYSLQSIKKYSSFKPLILVTSILSTALFSVQAQTTFPGTLTNTLQTEIPRYQAYNYAPAIMQDGGFRAYWCSANHGDVIAYSSAPSLSGPWSAPKPVFSHSDIANTFDQRHSCDPSILRIKNKYYLYYGGLPNDVDPLPENFWFKTRIGVASSNDGINWVRENNGNHIITARYGPMKEKLPNNCNDYGAGQPSTVYVNDYVYMSYTDFSGDMAGNCSQGTYLIRSKDPLFLTNVEVLSAKGWAPRTLENSVAYKLTATPSIDLSYSDVLNQFVIAHHGRIADAGDIEFKDPITFKTTKTITYPFKSWRDGPGLLKRPDGHLPVNPKDPTLIPIGIAGGSSPTFFPIGKWVLNTNLQMINSGVSLNSLRASNKMASLYEGYRLETPGLPVTVILDKQRIQFELPKPAGLLAKQVVTPSSTDFHAIPYLTSVYKGQKVIQAPGRPGAFVVKNSLNKEVLLPISCYGLVEANQSKVQQVSVQTFDKYPVGPALYCIS